MMSDSRRTNTTQLLFTKDEPLRVTTAVRAALVCTRDMRDTDGGTRHYVGTTVNVSKDAASAVPLSQF